jgi:hypothetical protein
MILRKILIIALLTWFSLTVIGYGIYRALPIILGPKIELNSPTEGEVVKGTSITVSGSVLRAKSLYINSIPTAFNDTGNFTTRLAVYPGSNILIIEAYDRFGRKVVLERSIGSQ